MSFNKYRIRHILFYVVYILSLTVGQMRTVEATENTLSGVTVVRTVAAVENTPSRYRVSISVKSAEALYFADLTEAVPVGWQIVGGSLSPSEGTISHRTIAWELPDDSAIDAVFNYEVESSTAVDGSAEFSGFIEAVDLVTYDTFELDTTGVSTLFQVAASIVGNGTIARSPSAEWLPSGELVTLQAVPGGQATFVEWSVYVQSTDHSIEVQLTAPLSLVATFDSLWTVRFELGAYGSAHSGSELEQVVVNGASATAPTIDVIEGWGFVGWSDNFDSVTSDLTVSASYDRKQYMVSFDLGDYGTHGGGSGLEQTVEHGEFATAPLVNVAEGWGFVDWSATFDSITSDLTVTARYAPIEYSVSLQAYAGGRIELDPAKEFYLYGEEVEIQAYPDFGYEFSGWGGDLDGVSDHSITLVVNQHVSASAMFSVREWPVVIHRSIAALEDGGRQVNLEVFPALGTNVYAVEEHIPSGWRVARIDDVPQINEFGNEDSRNARVKWGLFWDDQVRHLSYLLEPVDGIPSAVIAVGVSSFDGQRTENNGDSLIEPAAHSANTAIAISEPQYYDSEAGVVVHRLITPASNVQVYV